MIKKAHDVLNDGSHAVLYKIAQDLEFKLPTYVEEGIPLEKDASDKTSDVLFADEQNRRYPITDRANTWLSGAYFAKTASAAYDAPSYRRVASRILKAAELYGISRDVEEVMGKIAEKTLSEVRGHIEKEAEAAKSCYGEPETSGFPMFTKEQVKQACDYFEKHAYAYDWRRREKIAKNILRKTAEYGIKPTETVRKEAGAGFPRIDYLAENLMTREAELERLGLSKLAGDMRRTIKIICEASPEDLMAQLEPLREMVSGADELSGIDGSYGRRFNPPADFLFDIGDDEARDLKDDTVSLGGHLLSAKALSGLPKCLFESVLSPEGVAGLMDGGKLSPKKISITIVKMAPRDQKSLLNSIQDFTSNEGEEYEEHEEDEERKDDDEECGKECGKECDEESCKEDAGCEKSCK